MVNAALYSLRFTVFRVFSNRDEMPSPIAASIRHQDHAMQPRPWSSSLYRRTLRDVLFSKRYHHPCHCKLPKFQHGPYIPRRLQALLSLPRFANRSKYHRRSETQITSYSFEASGVNLPLTQCRITVSSHVLYAVELCKPVPFSTWSKVRNMSMGWLLSPSDLSK